MIRFISGIVDYIGEREVVIENNGIGYRILVPDTVLNRISKTGTEIKLYTYLNVREDAMQLFGFLKRDELELFEMLISVSGLGPKGGLAMLSALSADDIRFAIIAGDSKTISKTPGVGAKTAGKIVLELKDKISAEDAIESSFGEDSDNANIPSGGDSSKAATIRSEAVQALEALGYSATDALKAVREVEITDSTTTEEVLKACLKFM